MTTLALMLHMLFAVTMPACPTEDSNNCYWSAHVQGNGQGRSFAVVAGHVYYAR